MNSRTSTVRHHPAIEGIPMQPALQSPDVFVDFMGIRTRAEFVQGGMGGYQFPPTPTMASPPLPVFDEEYFEWVDVFESVAEATSDFVMVELGAGFGRWLMRGAAAARRKGSCRFRGIAIEAEPDHFRWLKKHARDNVSNIGDVELKWAAIGPTAGFAPFWVGDARAWYGQAVAGEALEPSPGQVERWRLKVRSALGWPPHVAAAERRIVWVPCVTLAEVVAPYQSIDLMDLDVQGLELEILSSAIDLVDARVRRIHIGTHSAAIESGLRALFSDHGWESLNDYASQSRVTTPYGQIAFGDGVQTWRNPRLASRTRPCLE